MFDLSLINCLLIVLVIYFLLFIPLLSFIAMRQRREYNRKKTIKNFWEKTQVLPSCWIFENFYRMNFIRSTSDIYGDEDKYFPEDCCQSYIGLFLGVIPGLVMKMFMGLVAVSREIVFGIKLSKSFYN